MVGIRSFLLAASMAASAVNAAGYTGKPLGFARDTTGGGDAPAMIPKDIDELRTWLGDEEPRTILLDKEYDFKGTEGQCVDCVCCTNWVCSKDAGQPGQLGIDVFNSGCDGKPVSCTFNNGTSLNIASDKTLVGLDDKGVIRGASLVMAWGVKNIIIQNIHITDLNPEYVWGGDAIVMNGVDNIWIDHVKTSLIGRQFIQFGFVGGERVTISNVEFDGRTDYSATCDNRHYWGIIAMGLADQVSFYNNWFHDTSGRSPDIGFPSTWHIFNNYWSNVSTALAIWPEPSILVEGNYFEAVGTVGSGDGGSGVFYVNETTAATCQEILGRTCELNYVSKDCDSLSLPAINTTVLPLISNAAFTELDIMPASQVKAHVMANAGVGKLTTEVQIPVNQTTPASSSSQFMPNSTVIATRTPGVFSTGNSTDSVSALTLSTPQVVTTEPSASTTSYLHSSHGSHGGAHGHHSHRCRP